MNFHKLLSVLHLAPAFGFRDDQKETRCVIMVLAYGSMLWSIRTISGST